VPRRRPARHRHRPVAALGVYEPGHHPDDSFRAAVAEGAVAHHWDFGDMPPVPGLTDDEVDQIIAFIREQQELHGFEPYPPP
jgi:cytochrome c1